MKWILIVVSLSGNIIDDITFKFFLDKEECIIESQKIKNSGCIEYDKAQRIMK